MKLAALVLSAAGIATVGTIMVSALPGSPRAPAAEAPVLPPKPAQIAATAPVGPPAKPFVVLPKPTPPAPPAPAHTAAAAPAIPPAATPPTPVAAPAAPAKIDPAKAEFDRLVAPVAPYPDPLLGHVLTAATYPLDVVEASRWAAEPAHRGLKGAALTAALQEQRWNPAVKALVPTPKVLELMAARIEWTRRLGNAVFDHRADVMEAVQRAREAGPAKEPAKQVAAAKKPVHRHLAAKHTPHPTVVAHRAPPPPAAPPPPWAGGPGYSPYPPQVAMGGPYGYWPR